MSATALSPEHQKILEALRNSGIRPPASALNARQISQLSVVDHGERYFYIPETGRPIQYEYFQKILLNIIAGTHSYPNLLPFYSTIEWSSVKKCLAYGERVWTTRGTFVPCEELIDTDFDVWAMQDEHEFVPAKAVATDNGLAECLQIQTQTGRRFTITSNHPLFTWYGWKEAANLTVGHSIALPYKVPQPPTCEKNIPELIRFLAYMIAEGSCKRSPTTFSQAEGAVLDDMFVIGEKLGVTFAYNGQYDYRLHGTATDILRVAGILGRLSHEHRVPNYIFRLNDDGISQFISALIDTDGWVSVSARGNNLEVGYVTISEGLAEDLAALYARLGLHPKISYKHAKGRYTDNVFTVVCTGASDIKKLARILQLRAKNDKLLNLLGIAESRSMPRASMVDTLPKEAWPLFLAGQIKAGIKWQDTICKFVPQPDTWALRRDVAESLADQFNIPMLQHKVAIPAAWDKIVSITSVGRLSTVAIEVPEYENFLCTNISHNTGKTSTSGAYARWRAEAQTTRDEILFFANDETQSRGRAYAAIQTSIELDPLYDPQKRVLLDKEGNVRWRIIEDFLEHVPTGTKVRAVNVDYRGEAGSNPSLSIWTECWGFDTDKQLKLFDEMTPVLTRYHSQRYLESYAGYTGKSKVQERVENLVVREGRQLTIDDIPDWPWPDEEMLPLYVNDQAGMFAYLDRGIQARKRMPWLVGPEADRYYQEQALTLTPEQYERLHLNNWVSPTTAFIPIEWWHQCQDNTISELVPSKEPNVNANIDLTLVPHVDDIDYTTKFAAYIDQSNWRQMATRSDPVVMAIDASVSGDCTALVLVSRHPQRYQDVALRAAYKWDPPRGGKIDYERTPNNLSGLSLWQQLIDCIVRYNVVEIAYDEWQLHHLMNQIRNLGLAWCRAFGQATPRDIADKQLYDLIKLRRIGYNKDSNKIDCVSMEQHLKNAARQQRAKEDTKLHIVKASDEAKIDLTVALSMACGECLRLDM